MTTTSLAQTPSADPYAAMYYCAACAIFTSTRQEMNDHKATEAHALARQAEIARIDAEWDAAPSTPGVPHEVALAEVEKDRYSGERTDLPVRPRKAAAPRDAWKSAPASEKATAYVRTLISERLANPATQAIREALNAARTSGNLTGGIVSDAIDALKALPKIDPALAAEGRQSAYYDQWTKDAAAQPRAERGYLDPAVLDVLPAGRYLVGESYVKVDRPTDGRWAGYVFVKFQQYGPETDGLRIALLNADAGVAKVDESHRSLLDTLLADPYAHALKFAQTTETCGICGRTLKVKESIERGIGPVCAAKFGR